MRCLNRISRPQLLRYANAATLLAGLACLPAFAATLTVTTFNDVLNPNDGLCSLREAIIAVNTATASGSVAGECPAGTGADVVLLSAGTYTLTIPPSGADDATTGDLNIMKPVTINGVGNPVVQRDPLGWHADAYEHDDQQQRGDAIRKRPRAWRRDFQRRLGDADHRQFDDLGQLRAGQRRRNLQPGHRNDHELHYFRE